MRRQGSGTYVGRVHGTALDEGLEKLVSYRELARRRGVELELGHLEIEERRLGPEMGELFGVDPDTTAVHFTRVLCSTATPAPGCATSCTQTSSCPRSRAYAQMLEKGDMVLDVLLKQDVPVAYTRLHITARLLTKRDRIGKALSVDDNVAAMEIDHVTCTAEGAPVEHSTDIFLPRSLDLHVMRWLEDMPPVPAIGRGSRA